MLVISWTLPVVLLLLNGLSNYETSPDGSAQLLECATNQSKPCRTETVKEFAEYTNGLSESNEVNCSDVTRETSDPKSLICSPVSKTNDERHQNQQNPQPIQVYIVSKPSRYNLSQIEPGSTLTIECRFKTRTPQRDFKFNLKWLRSVVGSAGNQSITASDNVDSMTIIAATTKIWTVQRADGLDLEVNDFQAADVGSYFCQAHSADAASQVFSEAKVDLELAQSASSVAAGRKAAQDEANENSQVKRVYQSSEGERAVAQADNGEDVNYSQASLSQLLPSLKVFPAYAEPALGDAIQLACLTSQLDPDPDASELEWSFEPIVGDRRSELLVSAPSVSVGEKELPGNVSVLGNVLIVWSMSEQHCGLYKCTMRLADFNLTVQATGELALRPASDAAPLVRVAPEFIRLPVNGSARLQCEATGYPAPQLSWYRVDGDAQGEATQATLESRLSGLAGLEFEHIAGKDTLAYCEQTPIRCAVSSQLSGSANSGLNSANKSAQQAAFKLITSISLVHLNAAAAHHQGQYVCRASNKHGSNQASSIVDVEFREAPRVRIAPDGREKTINLLADESRASGNVTFKCELESGKPQPQLRWLRSTSGKLKVLVENNSNNQLDNYDLTRVSSATSNVSSWLEDNGRTLVLSISTASLDDEGDYVCLAENEWGRHSAAARLLVRKAVSVRIAQNSPLVARLNASFQLDCLASGYPLPVDLEWSRQDLGAFFSLISRQTSALQASQEKAVLKFDRATLDESGEYTCNARDPLNSTNILRDTIMVLVEQPQQQQQVANPSSTPWLSTPRAQNSQLPKLMVRPTKVNALPGSDVTLDCLAVSGLQPTVVEWLAPAHFASSNLTQISPYVMRPYLSAASSQPGDCCNSGARQLLQFGSKLRILNVSRSNEGVYQCKGRNKIGVENAPALIKLIDTENDNLDQQLHSLRDNSSSSLQRPTKTKVAKVGANIELKCQVNGIEQPATSWSRDGLELPASSVQIGHNLWIQNLTNRDAGLYVCSARSKQPNKVIQAKINLLVRGTYLDSSAPGYQNLSAKIVASKSAVNLGDSITLECIISAPAITTNNNNKLHGDSVANLETNLEELMKQTSAQLDLEELESGVVWTNLHSRQSLFQDNVYIQNNLLIIYQLRPENSATYRCNYNELSQYTDYKLHLAADEPAVSDRDSPAVSSPLGSASSSPFRLLQVALGARLVLDCGENSATEYFWTRGSHLARVALPASANNKPLVFAAIASKEANLYQCHSISSLAAALSDQVKPPVEPLPIASFIVQVQTPVTRFGQRPVSFVTLPTIAGADHQLDIELKFMPEREHGLILFNGQQNRSASLSGSGGDYISLGLNKGHLEFRFELGDGVTLLRSLQPVALNQWHKVLIERNRRGGVMWLDKQAPVSNSSAGKFFNLNLDTVLYVGGHQHFLSAGNATVRSREQQQQQQARASNTPFYGYWRGFQGCVALLRVSGVEINLTGQNRSVAVGVFECERAECAGFECGTSTGVCQVDRTWLTQLDVTRRSSPQVDLRCICAPNWTGEHCERFQALAWPPPGIVSLPSSSSSSGEQFPSTTMATIVTPSTSPITTTAKTSGGACELLNPCSAKGTIECRSLTSTSYKCHCELGFTGDTCQQVAQFADETSVAFMEQAYLQLRFNKPEQAQSLLQQAQSVNSGGEPNQLAKSNSTIGFNATNFARSISQVEQQNISFKIMTRSSFGLLFYTGQTSFLADGSTRRGSSSSSSSSSMGADRTGLQTSKSMVANLLARLSPANAVLDYLAIALVDGHVELSYELGSGLAIVRSSQRVNDNQPHQIRAQRNGKWSRLSVDETHHYEGVSPGKLSALNSQTSDIYLGGLPNLAELANNTYLASLAGCLSQLEINSLGPLNLIKSDHYAQVRGGRNLAPCQQQQQQQQQQAGIQIAPLPGGESGAAQNRTSHKPYQTPTGATGSESDDPDEM